MRARLSTLGLVLLFSTMALAAAMVYAALPPGYILVEDIDEWEATWFCGCPGVRHFLQGPKLEGGASGAVVFDSKGNAYVACGTFIQVVRDHSVRILTGAFGVAGCTDGAAWQTTFGNASAIAMANDHLLYVVDSANFTVRKIEKRSDGQWYTETIAGVPGKQGHRDGPGRQALFTTPFESIAVDQAGVVYVLDGDWLRKIEDGVVTTLNAGTGRRDGPLQQAQFDRIMGGFSALSYDGSGNLYVADRWNMAVRKVDLKKELVTTVAGVLPGDQRGRPADGPAFKARFHPGGGPVTAFFNRRYDFLLVRSADEGDRVRYVAGGYVKTFGPAPDRKSDSYVGPWRNVVGGTPCGVDHQGNVYISGSRCIRVIKKVRALEK